MAQGLLSQLFFLADFSLLTAGLFTFLFVLVIYATFRMLAWVCGGFFCTQAGDVQLLTRYPYLSQVIKNRLSPLGKHEKLSGLHQTAQ